MLEIRKIESVIAGSDNAPAPLSGAPPHGVTGMADPPAASDTTVRHFQHQAGAVTGALIACGREMASQPSNASCYWLWLRDARLVCLTQAEIVDFAGAAEVLPPVPKINTGGRVADTSRFQILVAPRRSIFLSSSLCLPPRPCQALGSALLGLLSQCRAGVVCWHGWRGCVIQVRQIGSGPTARIVGGPSP